MWMSGWWFSASAISATLITNLIARAKSLNVYSRQSRGSSLRSFHFGTWPPRARASSGERGFIPSLQGTHFFLRRSMLGRRHRGLPRGVEEDDRGQARDGDPHRKAEQRLEVRGFGAGHRIRDGGPAVHLSREEVACDHPEAHA